MQLKEFNDKLLVCVSKEDLELEETDKEKFARRMLCSLTSYA
jgi:hypothetical protein